MRRIVRFHRFRAIARANTEAAMRIKHNGRTEAEIEVITRRSVALQKIISAL